MKYLLAAILCITTVILCAQTDSTGQSGYLELNKYNRYTTAERDTVFLKDGRAISVMFIRKQGNRILVTGPNNRLWIDDSEYNRLALNTRHRKNVFFTSMGDAGNVGISSLAFGVIGGILTGVGVYKSNPALTYAGIGVGGVSIPLAFVSLGKLVKASNHRF